MTIMWNPDHDTRLLIAIWETADRKFAWREVAQRMGGTCTSDAIKQHLRAIKKRRDDKLEGEEAAKEKAKVKVTPTRLKLNPPKTPTTKKLDERLSPGSWHDYPYPGATVRRGPSDRMSSTKTQAVAAARLSSSPVKRYSYRARGTPSRGLSRVNVQSPHSPYANPRYSFIDCDEDHEYADNKEGGSDSEDDTF
ncbi:hypothetical protein N7462_008984 [Penicillium macrosclerotiorum]|uniref:uncharacterized protein n=1 Tax=Penicillium macrosclerotiorum TaxID=303699 RepID=UPI002547EFB1|nr:uncharacterized protein N7462_008984 [Penicillium macrosclerotiorum]KAJ5676087.1 hypothetical protein N7462_008984 [Penicillium macrosclerotiorum]